eukprot:comp19333_c0_seq1/m.22250 comp19333_c0_seq1/g.22250  ORF comp19333_c0_seq1/g.22250 comp19333_c0_seq1/m.22250 type:complete len:297 (-) comp19333_c0_seq1:334-1224(-)
MSGIDNKIKVDSKFTPTKDNTLDVRSSPAGSYDGLAETQTVPFYPWACQLTNPFWWSMQCFIWGSAVFTAAGGLYMWPIETTESFDYYKATGWMGMIGISMYQTGCYLGILDAINLDRKLPDWDPKAWRWFAFETKSWYWWGWALYFFGTPFFWFPALLVVPGVMPADFDYTGRWILWDVIYWVPLTIGGLFFIFGSLAGWMDAQEGKLTNFKPGDVSWWATVLYTLGSIGFTLSSSFGFFAYTGEDGPVCCQYYGMSLSYFWGSISFLLASYMLLIDVARKDKIQALSFRQQFCA